MLYLRKSTVKFDEHLYDSGASVKKQQQETSGDDLLSQGAAPQVPSALAGLTAGFEKGPGVAPPLQSPEVTCC